MTPMEIAVSTILLLLTSFIGFIFHKMSKRPVSEVAVHGLQSEVQKLQTSLAAFAKAMDDAKKLDSEIQTIKVGCLFEKEAVEENKKKAEAIVANYLTRFEELKTILQDLRTALMDRIQLIEINIAKNYVTREEVKELIRN